jgi:hypothetical protein
MASRPHPMHLLRRLSLLPLEPLRPSLGLKAWMIFTVDFPGKKSHTGS